MNIINDTMLKLMSEEDYIEKMFYSDKNLNQYANNYNFLECGYEAIHKKHPEISLDSLVYSIYYWATYLLKYHEAVIGIDESLGQMQFKTFELIENTLGNLDCDLLEQIETDISNEINA